MPGVGYFPEIRRAHRNHEKKEKAPIDLNVTDNDLIPEFNPQIDHWGFKVKRGEVTTTCLWNAFKAVIIGTFLFIAGAGICVLGYYTGKEGYNPPSNGTLPEMDGNGTKYKDNTHKLNKLAYVGPLVMGVGGFIIVVTCVMTFEARDSTAKVTPARIKKGGGEDGYSRYANFMIDKAISTTSGDIDLSIQEMLQAKRNSTIKSFVEFSQNFSLPLSFHLGGSQLTRSKSNPQVHSCPSISPIKGLKTKSLRVVRLGVVDPNRRHSSPRGVLYKKPDKGKSWHLYTSSPMKKFDPLDPRVSVSPTRRFPFFSSCRTVRKKRGRKLSYPCDEKFLPKLELDTRRSFSLNKKLTSEKTWGYKEESPSSSGDIPEKV